MKKLQYIRPSMRALELEEEDVLLLPTSDIVTPIPTDDDDDDDDDGVDNGSGWGDY